MIDLHTLLVILVSLAMIPIGYFAWGTLFALLEYYPESLRAERERERLLRQSGGKTH